MNNTKIMNKVLKSLLIVSCLLGTLQNITAQKNWIIEVNNYWQKGQLSTAIQLVDTQINQQKKKKVLFTAYYWRGFLATEQQNLNEAKKWFAKAQEIGQKKTKLLKDVNYLNALGWYYIQSEQLALAEEVLQKALVAKTASKNNQFQTLSYLIQGKLEQNDLSKITDYFAVIEQLNYPQNLTEQLSLANQKIYYQVLANQLLPAQQLIDSLDLVYAENANLKTHPLFAAYLNYSSLLWLEIGNYTQAEYILDQAVQLNLENNRTIWNAYNLANLARVYTFYKKEKQVTNSIQQALTIFEKNNLVRKTCFTLLLSVDAALDKADIPVEIETTLAKIQTLIQVNQLEQTTIEAEYFSKLALFKELEGDTIQADTFYKRSFQIIEQIMGKENRYYSQFLNAYAIYLDYQGNRFEESEKAYLAVEKIDKKILGEAHPNYTDLLFSMAIFYVINGENEKAAHYFEKGVNKQLDLVQFYYPQLDEQTRIKYTGKSLENLDLFFQFALEIYPKSHLQSLVQTVFVQLKSLGERYQYYIHQQARKKEHTSQLLATIRTKKEQLLQYKLGDYTQQATVKEATFELKATIGQLERALNRQLDFRKVAYPITNQQLAENLEESEVVIDFISFNYFDLKKSEWTDAIHYYAILTKPNQTIPKFIFLTKEKTIKSAINKTNSGGIPQYVNYTQRGKLLYRALFQQLVPELEGISTVYLSPTRLLNRVAFETLPISDTEKLMDWLQVRYVTNVADILQPKKDNQPINKSIHLYGGANFQEQPTDLNDNSRGNFSNLPNTLTEIQQIDSLAQRHNWQSLLFTGLDCSETNCRESFTNTPNILHIGSHGYFYSLFTKGKKETTGQRIATDSSTAYLRSGILFSGADISWQSKKGNDFNKDGILTAFEISLLSMAQQKGNIDLIILSACQTGLGDILSNVEGQFGLKRAFKIAGAKQLILSLWKVPDAATLELMTAFYKNHLGGMDAATALHLAKKELKTKGKSVVDWGGFILLE